MKNLNFGLFISYFCANLNVQRCIGGEKTDEDVYRGWFNGVEIPEVKK